MAFMGQLEALRKMKVTQRQSVAVLDNFRRYSPGGYNSNITPEMIARAVFYFIIWSDDNGDKTFLKGFRHRGHPRARQCATEVIWAVLKQRHTGEYPWHIPSDEFGAAMASLLIRRWTPGQNNFALVRKHFKATCKEFYAKLKKVQQQGKATLPFEPRHKRAA